MALYTVSTGNTIQAADLNQCVYELDRQATQQEGGHYFISGWSNAASDLLQAYIPSRSRYAAPVSVSIDTTDQAATNVAAPSTGHLTVGGVQIFTTSTSAQVSNLQVGGAYTIQY